MDRLEEGVAPHGLGVVGAAAQALARVLHEQLQRIGSSLTVLSFTFQARVPQVNKRGLAMFKCLLVLGISP